MPFKPSSEQLKLMPKFSENDIPRYLFRIHTPVTDGTTTTSYVISPASKGNAPNASTDIFKESPRKAGDLLWNHLKWKRGHERTCNLTSWTSSLLFVLQYAFYRHKGADPKSELSNIQLMVLDTRGFPPGTFVKDMEIMRSIASELDKGEELCNFLQLREEPTSNGSLYYFGEYLSQGDLELGGRCAEAPMDMLVYLGLFDLHPKLKEETGWYSWAKPVLANRDPFTNLNFPPIHPPTDQRIVRKAIVIASACFGDRFAPPVALMLITLLPRRAEDPHIVDRVVAMFTSKRRAPFSLRVGPNANV